MMERNKWRFALGKSQHTKKTTNLIGHGEFKEFKELANMEKRGLNAKEKTRKRNA